MLKNVEFGREIFTLNLVVYITADLKKLVSDLFKKPLILRPYQNPIRIAPVSLCSCAGQIYFLLTKPVAETGTEGSQKSRR